MSRQASTYPAVGSNRRSRLLKIAAPLFVVACAVAFHVASHGEPVREVARSPLVSEAREVASSTFDATPMKRAERQPRADAPSVTQSSQRQRLPRTTRSLKPQPVYEEEAPTTVVHDG